MNNFYIFFALIIILFFVSRLIIKKVYVFWFLITKSKFFSMWISAIGFFPGTIVHELSHWLTAEIIRVPNGEIDLLPKKDDLGIKMGSVKIAKVGFIRRTIVGIAPFFSGLFSIYFLSEKLYFNKEWLDILINLGIIFLIFSISNTMFSSKKDLEVAFPFFSILGILVFVLLRLNLPVIEGFIDKLLYLVAKINRGILITILIDFVILISIYLFIGFFEKILKRRILVN